MLVWSHLRSHGLSFRRSTAIARFSTERMRWLNSTGRLRLTCQVAVRISSTSSVLTSEACRRAMRGKGVPHQLRHQSCVPPALLRRDNDLRRPGPEAAQGDATRTLAPFARPLPGRPHHRAAG